MRSSWSLRIPQNSVGLKRFLVWVYLITIGSCLPSFGFAAGECTSYETYLHWLGREDISGQGNDVTVSGGYAYVSSDTAGLHVIDIADPRHPQVVGQVNTPGSAYSAAVSGTYVYVADAPAGLQVVDVTNPEAPAIVGSVDTPGVAYGVAVWGTHAFVADGSHGLQVIDITDVTNPLIVGGVDTPGQAYGVAVSGAYAYVGDQGSMLVIDIADPQHPEILGFVDSLQSAYGLTVSGSFVYIGSQDLVGGSRLHVIDVSDPEVPQVVGSAAGVAPVIWNVTVSGGLAFVAGGSGGLAVVDISNVANPQVVSRARMPTGPDSPGVAYGVAVSGSLVYVSADVSLGVIDIANGLNPPVTGQVSNAGYGTPAIAGSYAYMGGFGSLKVIDVSNGQTPQVVGSVAIAGEVRDIAISGEYAYVANWEGGLRVVDISNPASPEVVGEVDTPDRSTAVAVSGNYAYVGDSGIQVVDISDPLNPGIVGSASTAHSVVDLAVSGNHAYVVNFYTGLDIYDLTNPQAPDFVGGLNLGYAPSVSVVNGLAYVANYAHGLSIIDVTNPASPLLLGSVETIDRPEGVAVSGSYAYVADYFAGLQVVDVTDPQAPRLVGTAAGIGAFGATRVAFSAGVVYIGGGNGILSVLPGQCERPVSVLPGSLLSFQATAREDGILLTWDTSSDDELVGFRVQRAESGKLDYRTLNDAMIVPPSPYRFLDVHARSGITYQYRLEGLDRNGRRELFGPISVRMDSGTTAQTWLGLATPNPSRGTAGGIVIPFTMAREGPALLRIFDLSGREVRTVVRKQVGPGERSAVWDGTTNEGEIAPPGIYFYRLETSDFVSARRLAKVD